MGIHAKIDELKTERERFEEKFKVRLAELQAEEDALIKASESADKLITSVQQIGIAPTLAYEILLEAGLISPPVTPIEKEEEGEILAYFTFPESKEGGRSSCFKFTKGIKVDQLQEARLSRWEKIKKKGRDYFLSNMSVAGKNWAETEEGKEFLETHFPAS